MLKKLSLYSGIVIPIWLFIGVAIAGAMNPGYSHVNQAMSELGAKGAVTHIISPIINNFPLGILFIAFGLYTISTFKNSKLAIFYLAALTQECGFARGIIETVLP